jgi:hypothetical protein
MTQTYLIFKRVAGDHPRWHEVIQVRSTSRPAALRKYGIPVRPRRDCVVVESGCVDHNYSRKRVDGHIRDGLYLAVARDDIDFDYRDESGNVHKVSA